MKSSTNAAIDVWLQKFEGKNLGGLVDCPDRYQNLELEELWALMDCVWDELGCSYDQGSKETIAQFYQHPVWLLNGYFIEQHELSLQHRRAISNWINQNNLSKILDYGGGFGTLARLITDNNDQAIVDIYEPFPTQEAIFHCQKYPRVKFVSELESDYDCLVSTDVLEHVPDPLNLFENMISSVKLNGYLLIANHFYPCIKCHLPSTFHFRYSFDEFAEVMGLIKIDLCTDSHATIYRKVSEQVIDWKRLRRMEIISRKLFPLREFDRQYILPWRARFEQFVNNPRSTLKKVRLKLKNMRNKQSEGTV